MSKQTTTHSIDRKKEYNVNYVTVTNLIISLYQIQL
jgi:hypothetical protein